MKTAIEDLVPVSGGEWACTTCLGYLDIDLSKKLDGKEGK
jgi:hypothetical protein